MLTGRGRFVDDLRFPEMLEVAFLRSPHPHARVVGLDASDARALPGVVAVFTGAELQASTATMPAAAIPMAAANPNALAPTYPVLATDRVRHVGDPVAMVVAESRYLAEDGCDALKVEYEALPPLAGPDDAADPSAPLLFEELGSNVLEEVAFEFGDPDAAFASAAHVVRQTVRLQRIAHSAIETRGCVAVHDRGLGELTFYASTQNAHRTRLDLAAVLSFPLERLRVVRPDMGASFGGKGCTCREDAAVAYAALALGRPVKWMEDRLENLLASPQGRGETIDLAAAVDEDGVIVGLDAFATVDHGAYPVMIPALPNLILPSVRSVLPNYTRVRHMRWRHRIVATNKPGWTTYRGPWGAESLARETLIDRIASELGLDPVEVRRRNMVTIDEQPYELVTGPTVQAIDVRESLERAWEAAAPMREERERARKEGRLVGIGVAAYLEPAPAGLAQLRAQGFNLVPERATAQLEPDGHATVFTQQCGHGQSHETTLAQVAADELGVPLDHVRLVAGDTASVPFGMIGTGASRSALLATGAVTLATRELRRKVLDLASALLEVPPEELSISGGVVSSVDGGKALPLKMLATRAYLMAPPGEEPGLRSTAVFTSERGAFTGGTHVCMVEVDRELGAVEVTGYLIVEDCGKVINPAVVDGQIRGSTAQGIGLALLEQAGCDESGNPIATSLMDYLLPTGLDVPRIPLEHMEGEPIDEFDFRGVGEGGTVAAPPAVVNAVADAVGGPPPGGWRLPLTPPRVLELLDVMTNGGTG
jgi:carbon-monoxide dehydrogenase large subunit